MTAHRIYHWKHGWIPLDHYAALKKAKGSEKGARRALANSHASGHAHHSVVAGTHHNGTHVRGIQPVASEHLKRDSHIVAAFNPQSRNFSILDQRGKRIGLSHEFDGNGLATTIPEHLGEHLNARGYTIDSVKHFPDGHRLLARKEDGSLKLFRADGTDKNMIDPPEAPPAPKHQAPRAAAATPGAPGEYGGHIESHEVLLRRAGDGSYRDYAVIRQLNPSGIRGSTDVVNYKLGEHIRDNNLRVIDYRAKVLTTVDRQGVIRKFKADGSNIDKPVMGRVAKFTRKDIGDWVHTEPQHAIVPDGSVGGAISAAKVKRAYVKGNKRVLIESTMTEEQAKAFMADVDRAFVLTHAETGHLDLTIRVPSGDRHLRNAYGYVWKGDNTRVHISPKVADGTEKPNVYGLNATYKMPALAQQGMTQALYTLVHELGHVVDNDHTHTFHGAGSGMSRHGDTTDAHKFHNSQKKEGLSRYGQSKVAEGYAEAYAQRRLGTAANSAAEEYARRYGWR
ncbi:hypothetical protein GCM10027053_51820 [Intrasporangium mesophilum]